jgi:aminopeptidase N
LEKPLGGENFATQSKYLTSGRPGGYSQGAAARISRIMVRTIWVLVLLAATALADSYHRQSGVDVQHYRFEITVSDGSDEIAGETTVDVRFTATGVTELRLDLAAAMRVAEVTPSVRFTHEHDVLTISLGSPTRAGERRQFMIRYRGVPASGLYFSKNIHGDEGIFSANWPNLARGWLPVIDHPYDKATSEFVITAPARYQVVANGLLQEERDLGGTLRLTHWKQEQPIAAWLNAVGIAQFAVRSFGSAKGVPLQTWVPYQEREAGIATFEGPSRQAMEFFAEHIGPYPYEKLANIWAWSPGFRGATEHASAIFFSCCQSNKSIVWHEIAHQWFGNAVTERDWDDVWLSEGFATYFTHLTREHYEGQDAFVAGLKADMPKIFAAEKASPGEAVVHKNLSDMNRVLFPSPLVYQKGGWVLHMLRGQVGTEKFWAGIREYYRLYRDRTASTSEFRQVMEETSGQDLGWFFRQWLERAASPALEWGWSYDRAMKKVDIRVTQTQAGDAYRLPLEVSFGGRLEHMEMTEKRQRFGFAMDSPPSTVVLDPNSRVLMEFKFAAQ